MMTTDNESATDVPVTADDQAPGETRTARGPDLLTVSPIVKALEKYMTDNGLSIKDLADEQHLDMPYSTLSSAMRGVRAFPSDREVRARIARMMDVSGLQVAIWCELLNLEDFIVKESFDQDAAKALSAMREDPSVSHFIPSDQDWGVMPKSGKIALVLMYQTLVGRRFFPASQVSQNQAA